jgi:protein TonB
MARQRLRSHLSGVPVSIGVHLVLLLVLVVIPLLDIVVPVPFMTNPSYVLAAPLPPPPSAAPRPPASPVAARAAVPSPIDAPDTIRPEVPVAPPFTPIDAVDTGLPPGFGAGEPGGTALAPPPAPPAPEPAKPQPQAVRAAQLPELPRKIVDAHPAYPEVARQARVEGTVILEAVIDTSGRVTQLRVLRSVPLLDQAALEAVRQWRYTPSSYGGRPVSVLMTITVRFTLAQ